MRPGSLRRHIFIAAASSLCLFLAVQIALFFAYNRYLADDAQALLDKTIDRSAQTITELSERLFALAGFAQVQPELANAASMQPSHPLTNEELNAVFILTRTVRESVGAVSDVVLVNRRGLWRSYISALGVPLLEQLGERYDFQDPSGASRFFFFPEGTFGVDPQFAFVIPLHDVDVLNWTSSCLGTAVLACDTSALSGPLTLSYLQRDYGCQLLDAGGDVIVRTGGRDLSAYPLHAERTVAAMGLTIRAALAPTPFFRSSFFLFAILLDACVLLASWLTFMYVSQRKLVRPIRALAGDMAALPGEGGRLEGTGVGELDVIVGGANQMLTALDAAHQSSLRAQSELIESSYRQREAELFALQSQINPHFLFNTMQCMRALALIHGAQDVADIATAMAGLLRYAISAGDRVALQDEVRAIEQYLLITDIRYQHRFAHEVCVPQDLRAVPCLRMSIQPLVENAILHGLSDVMSGGIVRIGAALDGQDMVIEVRDNGAGIPGDRLSEIQAALKMDFTESIGGDGLKSFGLYNIHRRLCLMYGERAGLTIESRPGDTRLRLRFPAKRDESMQGS